MTFAIHGLNVSRGVAIGRAVLVASSRVDVAHYFIQASEVDAEIERVRIGRNAVVDEIHRLQESITQMGPKEAPHELGALLAAAMAANLGWHVTYLGASLPAPEIAGAAKQNRARAVALSLVYPTDDPRMDGELTRLRELLPPEVALICGGSAIAGYRSVLDRIGARPIADLGQLSGVLDGLRTAVPGYGNKPAV